MPLPAMARERTGSLLGGFSPIRETLHEDQAGHRRGEGPVPRAQAPCIQTLAPPIP